MAIAPVTYQATIQNAQAVSAQKGADDTKPVINQQSLAVTVSKDTEQAQRTVTAKSESAKESALDPDAEGSGAAFSDNGKRKRKKEAIEDDSDGKVIKKGTIASFDVKV